MGNLFIGFPVPRAKIADMIAGAAPPLNHVANHQPDGSDPLIDPEDISTGEIVKWNGSKFIGVADPTGSLPAHFESHEPDGSDPLIDPEDISTGQIVKWNASKFIGADEAAGGIATRYDDTDIFLLTNFESLDGFYTSGSFSASVTLTEAMLELNTGTTNNSLAYFRKDHTIRLPVGTWNKARKFRVMAQFYSNASSTGINFIGTGKSYTLRHIGFCVVDGLLKGSVHNGSSQSTVTLEDWGGGPYLQTRKFEAIFTPGSKAEFYISGVKIDEITSGLPSGSSDAEHWICGYLKNTDGTNDLTLRLSQFEFTQAL